ncbi:growth hormone secretagogue receptor type 1-like [Asterias rubens]|uniref:growth hormone secretagogue receptor type 1-like n=1 Tax=Asterias rubens TaxID=7604 RepID=UPI0014550875|nr:growth hormone secretagogue receptor type 1-like [Asterias rubens]
MGVAMASTECDKTFNITEEEVWEWLYTSAEEVLITAVIPIISCIGFICNSLFLLVICCNHTMSSATNIYLAHLALADLSFLCLSALHHILRYSASPLSYDHFFKNSAECVMFFIIINTAYFGSIALVTMVTVERYLSLCHPVRHLAIRSRQRTNRIVATCWLVGFVLSVLTVPRIAVHNIRCLHWPSDKETYQKLPLTYSTCRAVKPWVAYYTGPLLNFPWLLAMIASSYMYVRIIQLLHKRRNTNSTMQAARTTMRNQVAKMLIVNGVVFFFCQIPYSILSLTGWICLIAQVPNPLYAASIEKQLEWIAIVAQLINNSVNPVIYGVMSPHYRSAFLKLFKFQFKNQCRRRQVPKSLTTDHSTQETRL